MPDDILNYQQALAKMEAAGQAHVLQYFNEINDQEKTRLLTQISDCDVDLAREIMRGASRAHAGKITPIEVLTHEQIQPRYKDFENAGMDAIRQGKVAALLLAGGQGSRLGVSQSKGMVNIGKTKELFIFECLFNNVLEVVGKAGCWIPFCVMTSESNNHAIKEFLVSKNFFGYNPQQVRFFVQDMLPAVDFEGKYLLSSKSSLALSPNGNGGWFPPMRRAGVVAELQRQGVEWINAFAIDNVLQKIADPLFIGAVIRGGFSCGAKVVAKRYPEENIGVICKRNGKPSIVEYFELTEEMIHGRDANGGPLYNYGVILNYLINLERVEEIDQKKMFMHSAKKKINTIDTRGQPYTPEKENGYKPETLILDMVELIGNCLPFEVLRDKEFAPIKYKEGKDSIVTARELLLQNGIEV